MFTFLYMHICKFKCTFHVQYIRTSSGGYFTLVDDACSIVLREVTVLTQDVKLEILILKRGRIFENIQPCKS